MQQLEYRRERTRWADPAAYSVAMSLAGIVCARFSLILMLPPFDPFVVLVAAPLWLLGVGLGICAALIHTRRRARSSTPALLMNVTLWVLLGANVMALAAQIG